MNIRYFEPGTGARYTYVAEAMSGGRVFFAFGDFNEGLVGFHFQKGVSYGYYAEKMGRMERRVSYLVAGYNLLCAILEQDPFHAPPEYQDEVDARWSRMALAMVPPLTELEAVA